MGDPGDHPLKGRKMGKTLVIAEKPSAGMDIAKVLGCTECADGYMEGNNYIVTWGVGHLVGLKMPEEHDAELKTWKMDALPFRFPVSESLKVLPGTAKQFSVVKKLIHRSDVDSLVNAGDAGREGLLIQEWIYRMAGNKKPVKVLWASSLTEDAIRKAFSNLHERKEFNNLLQEAEARAEADYMLGMNYSRGLTLTKGQGKIVLSYGRCQTSLLNLIVKRDQEIIDFKPVPYYEIWRTYKEGFSGVLVGADEKPIRFSTAEEADQFMESDACDMMTVSQYEKELKKTSAPALFNLADLQKEMGSKYGFDAEKTLNLAQALYEKHKVLSYPRTDSRVMSTDLAAELEKHVSSVLPILQSGDEQFLGTAAYEDVIMKSASRVKLDKKYVNDLKVTDHHALVPTINTNTAKIYTEDLNQDEKKVFASVIKRFLAPFLPDYQYVSVNLIVVSEQGNPYSSTGKSIVDYGWRGLYGKTELEKQEDDHFSQRIPLVLSEGVNVHVDDSCRKDKMTQAPPRYSVSSIISLMEKYGIGTSATRAEIIKKLMDERRSYIVLQKGKYFSTELGQKYIGMIPEELKTEYLTAQFEEKLEKIGEGELSKDQMLDDLYREIDKNLKIFSNSAEHLDTSSFSETSKTGTSSGLKCPKCGKAVLKGKYSWYCTGYKEGCKFSIPLEVAHKALTENQVKQLLEKGKTGKLKGFKKKSGGDFSAALKLESDGKISFDFGQ